MPARLLTHIIDQLASRCESGDMACGEKILPEFTDTNLIPTICGSITPGFETFLLSQDQE